MFGIHAWYSSARFSSLFCYVFMFGIHVILLCFHVWYSSGPNLAGWLAGQAAMCVGSTSCVCGSPPCIRTKYQILGIRYQVLGVGWLPGCLAGALQFSFGALVRLLVHCTDHSRPLENTRSICPFIFRQSKLSGQTLVKPWSNHGARNYHWSNHGPKWCAPKQEVKPWYQNWACENNRSNHGPQFVPMITGGRTMVNTTSCCEPRTSGQARQCLTHV